MKRIISAVLTLCMMISLIAGLDMTVFATSSAELTHDETCGEDCADHNHGVSQINTDEDCVESEHNYPDDCNETWVITKEGAKRIAITFSEDTETETDYDFITIYDGEYQFIGRYSGTELAGKRIVVHSSSVEITLTSDSSVTCYGFALTKVEAYYEDCLHPETEVINAQTAACDVEGYTGDTHCKECQLILQEGEVIPAEEHNYVFTETVAPECETWGCDIYVCTKCKAETNKNYTDPLGHDYVFTETVAPECENRGYDLYICSKCQGETKNNYVDALGHNYNTSVVAPTCMKDGYTEFKCSACEDYYKDYYISRIGHNFENGVCVNCNRLQSDCIESDHDYSDNTDQTWTITKEGAKRIAVSFSDDTYTETNCDYIYIYDGEDNLIGAYTGLSLAGKRVVVHSSTVKIRLTSDSSVSRYGFALTDVEAYYEDCTHANTEIRYAYDSTCSSHGNSGDTWCLDCQITVKTGEELPLKPHDYVDHLCTQCGNVENQLFKVSVSDGSAVVTGYIGEPVDIVIPASIGGYPVTEIKTYAFAYCRSLESITIPGSVEIIGDNAFYYCSNLKNATITDGVTEIGSYAFSYCSSLESITIPGSVKNIYDYAFSNCKALKSVIISEGVTYIGDYAFFRCVSLNSISIPDTVTEMGEATFYMCDRLISATLPETLTVIPDYVFGYCGMLSSIVISSNTTSIGEYAFCYCKSLKSFDVPDSALNLGKGLFNGCSGLVNVTLPEDLSVLPEFIFYECCDLKSIDIPETVTAIGEYAFYNCSNLREIDIPEAVSEFESSVFAQCNALESFTISSNITKIHSSAFESCTSLKEIIIPDTVTDIGYNAFSSCSSLEKITLPGTITDIKNYTFHGCSSLKEITLPESITSIGEYAFYQCNSLTEVTIHGNVTDIGECAFSYCKGLKEVVISDGVTDIGQYAFSSCENLILVTIPESITTIGGYAFDNCKNLFHVFYSGSEEAWNSVTAEVYIGSGFDEVTKHFDCTESDVEYIVTMDPTCTGQGVAHYVCNLCDQKKYVSVDKDKHNGKFITTIAPDCVDSGYDIYLCESCGKTYEINQTNSLGHIYEKSVTMEPACAVRGYTEYKCSVCDKLLLDDFIPSKGHTITDGLCTTCGMAEEDCIESAHNYDSYSNRSWYINKEGANGIAITFSADTYTEEEYDYINIYGSGGSLVGSYCGDELAGKTIYVPYNYVRINLTSDSSENFYGFALTKVEAFYGDCDHTNTELRNQIDASCNSMGYTGDTFCTDCGVRVLEGDYSAYTDHTGVLVETVTPTCSRTGYDLYLCSVCADVYIENQVDTLSHTYEDGYCTECGKLEGFLYEIRDAEVVITGYEGNPTELIIPETIHGCPVTSIDAYAFEECESLVSIIIPEGVTSIGSFAFTRCINLTNVTLPDTLTEIGRYSFESCESLVSISLPKNLKTINNYLFAYCYDLTEVIIPDSVTDIYNRAFYCCTSLTDITIPEGVCTIGDAAFAYCSKLESVTIPKSVTSIGYDAFEECENLQNVYISDLSAWCNIYLRNSLSSPLYVADNLYLNGELVVDVILTDDVVDIPYYAFSCNSLRSIVLPDSVTRINDNAFNDCANLETIEFSDSLTFIGWSAFYNCTKLKSVEIPDTVITLGNSVFWGCSSLEEVTLSSSLTYIDDYTFAKCTNLKNVCIKGEVTEIGYGAFFECVSLNEFDIPDTVTRIGGMAFENCTGLTEISLPASVELIEESAFYGCTNLTEIVIPEENSLNYVQKAAFKKTPFYENELNYIDGILTLGNYPLKVNKAFEGVCRLPDGAGFINDELFEGCEEISVIVIPEGVNYIDDGAFIDCESLVALYLPESLEKIYYDNFDNSDYLFHVLYSGSEEMWNEIDISVSGNNRLLNATKHFNVTDEVISYTVTEESSCTEKGKAVYTCSICEAEKEVRIPLLPHEGSYMHRVDPSCEDYGYDLYMCATCHQIYETNWIDPAGHSSEFIETVAPDCYNQGYDVYRCTVCQYQHRENYVASLDHIYMLSEVIEPACTEQGYTVYKCHLCSDTYYTDHVDSTGHKFEEGVCVNCGNAEEDCIESEHPYSNYYDNTWVITKEGAKRIAITFSSDTYTETNYDFIYIYDGEDNIIGSYTGASLAGERIVVKSDVVKIRLATDESESYYGFAVKNIEAYYEDCLHTDTVLENELPATCTQSGYTGDVVCTECQECIELGEIIESLGHDPEFVEKVAPTCNSYGYDLYVCKVCDSDIIENYVDLLEHSGEFLRTVAPTCSTMGYDVYFCTNCKSEYNDYNVEELGHDYHQIKVVEPNCYDRGYTEYQCSICQYSYTSDYISPTGHAFEDGVCVNCNMLQEDCIESDHDYADNTDETWTISKPGAKSISVTFSIHTQTESGYDFITITDKFGDIIGKYSGYTLAGKTITVNGDVVNINLTSDGSETRYGFAVVKVDVVYDDVPDTNIPEDTTVAENTTIPEDTTVAEDTTMPEDTTAAEEITEYKKVYFENTLGWASVYAYIWNENMNNGWPGEPMVASGNGYWSADLPVGFNVVFTNGEVSGGKQTASIVITEDDNNCAYADGGEITNIIGEVVPTISWKVYVAPVETTPATSVTTEPTEITTESEVTTDAAETKPAETKPAETKPAETKPAETKPAETKPVETDPVETKPAETKPAETKPAETKPAETKPAETKPTETKPTETKPAETKPTETKPAETKPAETKPAETKPVETEPTKPVNVLTDEKTQISVETDNTDVVLKVIEIEDKDEFQKVEVALVGEKISGLYDINLICNGAEIQPDGKVTVRIPVGNALAKVYRVEADGSLTDMNAVYKDGYLEFVTDHFSLYVVAEPTSPTNPDEPVEDKGILGDVNGDGKVNVKDATLIQKAAAKISELTEAENIRANVNGDKKVNVKDATAIQKFAAKIKVEFPIGEPIV